MLGAIETAHTGVGLVPDAEVEEVAQRRFAGGDRFRNVAPVHADEGDRTEFAGSGDLLHRRFKEAGELVPGHLPGSHRKLAVTRSSETGHMPADRHVVWKIGKASC